MFSILHLSQLGAVTELSPIPIQTELIPIHDALAAKLSSGPAPPGTNTAT